MELNLKLNTLQKYWPIEQELIKAKEKHPKYPKDIFWQVSIISEEAGEIAKAVNDYVDGKTDIEHVKEELRQTAAVCMRMLENLPPKKIKL